MSSFAEIAEKKSALDAARPLPPAIVRNLAEWFEQELTVAALLAEKAGLDRQEIINVMERGKPLRHLPPLSQQLIFNHRQALELMARLSYPQEGATSERTIQAFHSVLYQGLDDQAGQYRDDTPNDEGGIPLPDPAKLRVSMSALSAWLKRAPSGPETAIEAHIRLIQLQPFSQGNAPIALLVTNLILNRAGFPPLVVRPDAQSDYAQAVTRTRVHDDRIPLRQLFVNLIDESLDVCLVGAAHAVGHAPETDGIGLRD